MTCTQCGEEVPAGKQAIFGLERGDGTLAFGWTCCHRLVGDVAVILASAGCVEAWLAEHPEHTKAVTFLLVTHRDDAHNLAPSP